MTAKLTQLFRFLLLAYFVGSGILIMLLLGLQQYQAEKRAELQLQQYAELLKVSLRPVLTQRSAEQLTSQLLELHYSALLPIAAIGVYHANGEPLATAGLSKVLPTHLAATPVAHYQLQPVGSRTAAILSLSGSTIPVDHALSFQNPEGYLVIVPEDISDNRPFLLLTSLVWLIYTLIFVVFTWYLQGWWRQRNASLTRLLDASSNTKSVAEHAATSTQLPTELKVVQGHLTQLAERFSAEQQLQQQQSVELQKLQHLLLQLSERQQHTEQQWLLLQKEISLWLSHAQLIWQRQEQLSPPMFFALMRLQLLSGLYQFNPPSVEHAEVVLSDWLMHQIPSLNQLLPHGVNIDWLEGENNNSVAIKLDGALLEAILQALLLLALRSDNLTRISLRLRVERLTHPQLVIQLNCDGQGLAPELNKQLKSAQAAQWQWRDVDVVLLQRLAEVLEAKLNVQSLEGLGLSIALPIPVQLSDLPFVSKMGNILLFDADAERLSERIMALKALAIQATGCKVLNDLEYLLKKSRPDLLVVMLPAITPNQEWLTFIRQYQQQGSLQVFAPASHFAQWQAVIPCHSAAEFCLTLLNNDSSPVLPSSRCKKLLVVDDNETNQAFIRILLQHKAVDFQAALTGGEVLQLCQQQQFDLILLDISLPDISGVEVARQLRRLPAYQKTPILAFTAHALPAEVAEFKLAGMDDILLKPLDPAKFETLLARYQLY